MLYFLENGYGCLPVNNCEVKDENSPCSELQFLVHRSMQKILCCSLKSGWDTNKEMFNWNAIEALEAAANDVGEAERESRFFTHINKGIDENLTYNLYKEFKQGRVDS